MFGPVGLQEIIVILLVAFLVFGPKRLPEIGRSLGRGLREFKKNTTGLVDSISDELDKPVPRANQANPVPPQAPPTPAPTPQKLVNNPVTPQPSDQVEEVVINLDEEQKK
ncbi:twin-arginine translocase TatA/TatE family subunit [Acanthopleuribacter pedis]|uniref:Sec-independent protein translocase protein TatA n=1 Tax=Acanthopleuribacter pedis TaxID=442870 RepID=A0A8J7U7H5_9BACT|nr:twin-arginine translocase TatA/TatE family subunit [Acanthopleuribacter pedis]MBO1323009.1 twin-arginine translocase TatA/TatE family subunit [Acanthopleuribacter pedis]